MIENDDAEVPALSTRAAQQARRGADIAGQAIHVLGLLQIGGTLGLLRNTFAGSYFHFSSCKRR